MGETVADNNKRIAKNTMILYIRMLVVMAVSLFTSRITLNALGANDFGIYSVVGGIVALFSIISGSLSSSISRFVTFELGRGDMLRLRKVFANSLLIQILIILSIIVSLLPVAIWFVGAKMNISPDMLDKAYWVLAFSVVTFCVNLLSTPYHAVIISHERMTVFATITIIDVMMKLCISYSIMLFDNNRLVLYAALLLISTLIVQAFYMIYCIRHFEECKTAIGYDKEIIKEIGGFASWNFIGSASSILRNQGNNILLNIFYGTIVNAGYAISMQVNNAVTQLSNNFMTSVNPQITKYYAQKELESCIVLMFRSSRVSFFLTWLLGSIVLLNTGYILQIWLSNVPEDTVIFVRLILIMSLIESISIPLITGMLATGVIRNYQIVVGGFQMLNLPISYLVLKYGAPASSPLYIAICISIICLFARIIMLQRLIPFNIGNFITKVLIKDGLVVCISLMIPFILKLLYGGVENFYELVWQSLTCVTCTLGAIFIVGCTPNERRFIVNKIRSIKQKF